MQDVRGLSALNEQLLGQRGVENLLHKAGKELASMEPVISQTNQLPEGIITGLKSLIGI